MTSNFCGVEREPNGRVKAVQLKEGLLQVVQIQRALVVVHNVRDVLQKARYRVSFLKRNIIVP